MRFALVALVMFLSPILETAQTGPTASVSHQTEVPAVTLKTTTRLVQVNVIVRDSHGAPVAGLNKDDFTLLDQNQLQTITIFSQEGASIKPATAKPLPPNVYTNRMEALGKLPESVTVVLLDTLNTKLEDQSYARQQVIKFLKQLHSQDHIALYALTTKLTIIHEFTQDSTILLRALDRYLGQASPQLDASATDAPNLDAAVGLTSAASDGTTAGGSTPPLSAGSGAPELAVLLQMMQEVLNNAYQTAKDFNNITRAQTTAAAFEAIANHLARVPGRKNLIWVSGSFPIGIGLQADSLKNKDREIQSFERQLERAERAMNQANMAIYPIDARGLMISPEFNSEERDTTGVRGQPRPGVEIDQNIFATMDNLAERTGGRVFRNSNDIAGAVRKVLSDSELTYTLAFYPSHGKWDGRFHEIRIRSNRPNLQLHYRKGYIATPNPPDDEAEKKANLDAAAGSPIDVTGLSVLVRLTPPEQKDSNRVGLAIVLDLHELLFVDTQGRKNGVVDFVFVQRDAVGKQLNGDQKHAEFNMELQKYEAMLSTGFLITNHVTLLPAATQIKIVVRDARSGVVGSVTAPLQQFQPSPSK
jgi:VWFA-related protein